MRAYIYTGYIILYIYIYIIYISLELSDTFHIHVPHSVPHLGVERCEEQTIVPHTLGIVMWSIMWNMQVLYNIYYMWNIIYIYVVCGTIYHYARV